MAAPSVHVAIDTPTEQIFAPDADLRDPRGVESSLPYSQAGHVRSKSPSWTSARSVRMPICLRRCGKSTGSGAPTSGGSIRCRRAIPSRSSTSPSMRRSLAGRTAELLGSRSRASKILNRERPLSPEQIQRIAEAWRLPLAALAEPDRFKRDTARAAPHHGQRISTR